MNRTQSKPKTEAAVFNLFASHVHRALVAVLLVIFIPAAAVAQYAGGGSAPSYGSKGAVIGGVVAGAALGAGLLYWKFHGHSKLQGCVAGDGGTVVTEKDNQSYKLKNLENQSLRTGERVELFGKKVKDSAGERTFEVQKFSKQLGRCTATNAAAVRPRN